MINYSLENWLEKNIGFENPKLGLERIQKALEIFKLKTTAKIITVAGTNGKGTTSRLIADSLAQNSVVSLFTSPHIISVTERFWVNNNFISSEKLLDIFEKNFKDLKEKDLNLSFFEFLFFSFFREVCMGECDYIVLEVGLGGRFDATNSVDTDLAIITSISRDHIEFFGNSYKKILYEKVGIAREGVPLISCFELSYLNNLLDLHRKEVGFEHHPILSGSGDDFMTKNKALASKCLELLKQNQKLVVKDQVKLYAGSTYYQFGSHNLDAVRKLVQYLKQNYYTSSDKFFDVVYLSFTKRERKEIDGMISLFKDLNTRIILLDFNHFKALTKVAMIEIAKNNGLEFATKQDIKLQSNRKILVSGSNYFVGDFARHYFF